MRKLVFRAHAVACEVLVLTSHAYRVSACHVSNKWFESFAGSSTLRTHCWTVWRVGIDYHGLKEQLFFWSLSMMMMTMMTMMMMMAILFLQNGWTKSDVWYVVWKSVFQKVDSVSLGLIHHFVAEQWSKTWKKSKIRRKKYSEINFWLHNQILRKIL